MSFMEYNNKTNIHDHIISFRTRTLSMLLNLLKFSPFAFSRAIPYPGFCVIISLLNLLKDLFIYF